MSTIIPLVQNNLAPFTFSPVLDGTAYNAIVTWGLWGQRSYLNLLSPSGELVVSTAIVSSLAPVNATLTTTSGLYTGTVIVPAPPLFIGDNWSISSVNVPSGATVAAITPSGIMRLSQPATATGADPSATFTFVVDLVAGFGFASTLVFDDASQSFVITP